MKKVAIISVSLFLLLRLAGISCAAVHTQKSQGTTDWFSTTENWYSIQPDQAYFDLFYQNQNSTPGYSQFGGEYYQNDQTFIDITQANAYGATATFAAGSYLWANGLFTGLSYDSFDSGYTAVISPGYRLNLENQGYAALSLDYRMDNLNDNQVIGYDLDFKFYPRRMKVYGQLYLPNGGDATINLNGNYQVNPDVVVGAGINASASNVSYTSGLTWMVQPFVFDAQVWSNTNGLTYDIAGMYQIKNLGIGLLYEKVPDITDPQITLRTKYEFDNARAVFKYGFANGSWPQNVVLAYEMKV